jgi:hypothetical protein
MNELDFGYAEIEAIERVTSLARSYLNLRRMVDVLAKTEKELKEQLHKSRSQYNRLAVTLSHLLGEDTTRELLNRLRNNGDPRYIGNEMRPLFQHMSKEENPSPTVEVDAKYMGNLSSMYAKLIVALEKFFGRDKTQHFIQELAVGEELHQTALFKEQTEKATTSDEPNPYRVRGLLEYAEINALLAKKVREFFEQVESEQENILDDPQHSFWSTYS